MKIIATFDICDRAPSFIDVEMKDDSLKSISWEEDSISISGNQIIIEDAYFSGEDTYDYDYETQYLFENANSILDDFENNIIYNKIEFSDGAGMIEAQFIDDENNPMKRNVLFTPFWEIATSDNEITEDDDKQNNEINDYHTQKLSDINIQPENISNEEYQDTYNNNYFVNGQEFYALKTVEQLSESPSPEQKLQQIQIKQQEKVKQKEKNKTKINEKDDFDR